jgi:flagellar basal body-associated protein FliL
MNFIIKIENAINLFLNKLGGLILKSIPGPFKKIFSKLAAILAWTLKNFKSLPLLTKNFLISLIAKTKSLVLSLEFKTALIESYKNAMNRYKETSSESKGKMKTLLLTPFLIIGQWLQGLSASQSMVLLSFSCASILAVIGIGFSGHKLLNTGRSPASISEEVAYERPDYYKKQTKHLEITNLRLPVYVAQINEIRSVDIDFIATMTNRNARMFLEKHELQLRDHLILQLEPSIASFPLKEEGKEIIRRKILNEVNDFLKQREIEGEVVELKITYVLAN